MINDIVLHYFQDDEEAMKILVTWFSNFVRNTRTVIGWRRLLLSDIAGHRQGADNRKKVFKDGRMVDFRMQGQFYSKFLTQPSICKSIERKD